MYKFTLVGGVDWWKLVLIGLLAKSLWFAYGFEVPKIGLSSGLMLLWNNELNIRMISSSFNHITTKKLEIYDTFLGWFSRPTAMIILAASILIVVLNCHENVSHGN